MTLAIISGLAVLLALSSALALFSLLAFVMMQELRKDSLELVKSELRAERSLRTMAEAETAGLKKSFEMQSQAIEQGALPWIAKNDKIEARYETEAIDRMENPSFYTDIVDGLGGTR